jgi:nicotinamidase-related amidase
VTLEDDIRAGEEKLMGNVRKALMVIDIQEDYTGTTAKHPFPYKDSDKLIASVNKVIEAASKKNIITAYIRQEFSGFVGVAMSKVLSGGTAIKGTPGVEIDKRVAIVSNHTFSKHFPNAFSNRQLEAFLDEYQVNNLYLAGLDAQFCVYFTAKGALKKGHNVTIITDCIALRAREKWDNLLNKYKQDGINLISSCEFIEMS